MLSHIIVGDLIRFLLVIILSLVLFGCASQQQASESNFTSNFFKGNEKYLNEDIKWSEATIYKDNFDYKILSALRMLGYNFDKDKKDSQLVHVRVLEQFKRENNIVVDNDPNSEIITKETLLALDRTTKEKEDKDATVVNRFSLHEQVITDHPNSVSEEFISAMIVNALSALPEQYVDLEKENMLGCYVRQCAASSGAGITSFIFKKGTDEQLTTRPMDDNFDFYEARFLGYRNENKVNLDRIKSLYMETTIIIHEYSHYLDRAVYPQKPGTKQGIINTKEFYKISFENVDELGEFPIYYKTGTLRIRDGLSETDFVDSYAMSRASKGYTEDFAESFAAYVVSGKNFRKEAEQNNILKQKYEWLKNNVFNGIEYETDLPRLEQDFNHVFNGELKKR